MATQEVHNGRAKGRAVPALPTHTFQDSGVTVRLRKLSPMTSQRLGEQVRREFPPPEPPTYDVQYGDQTVKEVNDADPVYLARRERWTEQTALEFNERMLKLVCLDAIELELGPEEQAQITRKKRSLAAVGVVWEDDPKLDVEENARLFYVQHCCLASPDDMKELYAAVTARSQPTEAAVQAHIDTFSGDA